ncbi:MAG: NAD(P)-dependent oxidoreductase [Spirochaetaceae bacterium]|nr:MAG: NAD(P)-dependent oxidoreductase [Spirochaetaceae bacterium]
MHVLVTGAYGIVGRSAVRELETQGHEVRIFDLYSKKNKHLAGRMRFKAQHAWGDITNLEQVRAAVRGMDAVVHLAAIIPPLADKKPELARSVNVEGTVNVIHAMQELCPDSRLIFSSSIAIYGDRLAAPFIKIDDPLIPNEDDHYAHHKIECERLIRSSRLSWTIMRLSYIVSAEKLKMDPIMFDVPLATSLEICDTTDAGLAIANALAVPESIGETLHIAGGERCRTTYRNYLAAMLDIFGLGHKHMPENAFRHNGFHCGFMDTQRSQSLLRFQRKTLMDYFSEVSKKTRFRKFFLGIIRYFAQKFLYTRSPYPAANRA